MFSTKELLPKEDRGVYLVLGFTDEGSSFDYTQKRAQEIEKRLLPLLQAENSPYDKFIMRVPGFGSSANSFNSFIIIALLEDWKDRDQDAMTIMRQAIGKIVTVPQTLAFPISPQSIRVSNYNKPVQMVILGKSYEELEKIQNEIISKMRENTIPTVVRTARVELRKRKIVSVFSTNACALSDFLTRKCPKYSPPTAIEINVPNKQRVLRFFRSVYRCAACST